MDDKDEHGTSKRAEVYKFSLRKNLKEATLFSFYFGSFCWEGGRGGGESERERMKESGRKRHI